MTHPDLTVQWTTPEWGQQPVYCTCRYSSVECAQCESNRRARSKGALVVYFGKTGQGSTDRYRVELEERA